MSIKNYIIQHMTDWYTVYKKLHHSYIWQIDIKFLISSIRNFREKITLLNIIIKYKLIIKPSKSIIKYKYYRRKYADIFWNINETICLWMREHQTKVQALLNFLRNYLKYSSSGLNTRRHMYFYIYVTIFPMTFVKKKNELVLILEFKMKVLTVKSEMKCPWTNGIKIHN